MFLQAAVFNAVAAEGDLSSGWERRHKSFALIRLGAPWLSHPTAQATYEDEPPLCRKTPVTNEILAIGDRKRAMTDKIRAGMIIIKDGTQKPQSVVVDTKPYSAGWSSVMKTSAQLGRDLESAGWTFFYMAGEIRTRGFGFNDESRTRRAVALVIDAVKLEKCNCLEITQIGRRSFLGLPYTSIVAHARHIQTSRRFQGVSDVPANVRSPARDGSKLLLPSEAIQAWENEGGSQANPNHRYLPLSS